MATRPSTSTGPSYHFDKTLYTLRAIQKRVPEGVHVSARVDFNDVVLIIVARWGHLERHLRLGLQDVQTPARAQARVDNFLSNLTEEVGGHHARTETG